MWWLNEKDSKFLFIGEQSTTDYPSRDVEDDVSSVSSFSSASRASPLPYGEMLLHFPGDSSGSV